MMSASRKIKYYVSIKNKQYKYIPNYTLTHLRFKITFFLYKDLKDI